MPFTQEAPQLANAWRADPLLQDHLRHTLPDALFGHCGLELDELGALAAGELSRLQHADRTNEPRLVQWDPWGNRIDRVECTAGWERAAQIALRYGLVATPYASGADRFARIVQFAKVYLFAASTDVYSCPLAMTDGAARALLDSGNAQLIARALPRLTSSDPAHFWTSGQWMTEASGGSDVGLSRTEASRDEHGTWRLTGRKWFTSAAGADMALTLARPSGNPDGGRGLALFYLEVRDARGRLNGISVNRLKDKLGTRKVPTAELELHGAVAEPVAGLDDGVRRIAPMLNVTRTWNAMVAVSLLRRGLVLAVDYARRRLAFGGRLIDKPLHADTLAGVEAECQAAFHLAFFVSELLGRVETGLASESQASLLRLVTPIAKLFTARAAVDGLTEVVEAFGGAGYVEDTGIPVLLRDAHVLPIWEGTTNVLALDALRTLLGGGLATLQREVRLVLQPVGAPMLVRAGAVIEAVLERLRERLTAPDRTALEADGRRIVLTAARVLAAALMARHAQCAAVYGDGRYAGAALRRFLAAGLDRLGSHEPQDVEDLLRLRPASA